MTRAPYWAEAEIKFIAKRYGKIDAAELAKLVNSKFHRGAPVRTALAIRKKAELIGVTREYEFSQGPTQSASAMRRAAMG
jgi:hypothetical protein